MAYRIEVASQGRAGCRAADCKKEGVKIKKGEVRMGTWVEGPDWASFQWRHWGCTTPKVLSNIKDKIEGNFDFMDGYDELPEEWQEKLRQAVEEGHVPDEDWKGDPEYNRPGKTGFRSRARKQTRDASVQTDPESEEEEPVKKRGKKRLKAEDDGESEEAYTPVPTKRSRKAVKAEVNDEDEVASAPAKRSRKKVKQESQEDEDIPLPKKPGKKTKTKKEESQNEPLPLAKKSKRKMEKEEDESGDVRNESDDELADSTGAPQKGKQSKAGTQANGRVKKGRKANVKVEEESKEEDLNEEPSSQPAFESALPQVDGAAEAPGPRNKKARKSKVKAEQDLNDVPAPLPIKAKRSGRAPKAAAQVDGPADVPAKRGRKKKSA